MEACYDAGALPKRLFLNPRDTITKKTCLLQVDKEKVFGYTDWNHLNFSYADMDLYNK